jgi:hypothetical protein
MAKLISKDDRAFTFEHRGRVYCVPFGRKLTKRNPTGRELGHIAAVSDSGHGNPQARWGTKPKQKISLASLAEDYDLSSMVIEGDPLPVERTPMAAKGETGALTIVTASIAGLPLEMVEGDWVTLRSLFEPFGKEVHKQIARLETWAKLGKVQLRPRGAPGNLPESEVRTIHRTHVAQAIAELDTRGMDEDILKGFIAFKRECADALDAYFTKGVAENPRMVAAPVADIPAWSRALFEALGSSVVEVKTFASTSAAEAKGEIKAVRGDVEAVAGMVAEVDKRKADRTEVEAMIDQRFAAVGRATVGRRQAARLRTGHVRRPQAGRGAVEEREGPRIRSRRLPAVLVARALQVQDGGLGDGQDRVRRVRRSGAAASPGHRGPPMRRSDAGPDPDGLLR